MLVLKKYHKGSYPNHVRFFLAMPFLPKLILMRRSLLNELIYLYQANLRTCTEDKECSFPGQFISHGETEGLVGMWDVVGIVLIAKMV
jgi:hypothetical protein